MSEYYEAYNHTKRERFCGHACGGGVCYGDHLRGYAGAVLWYLMTKQTQFKINQRIAGRWAGDQQIVGRWAGDVVEIIGDNHDTPDTYADIGELVNDWLRDRVNVGVYSGTDYNDEGDEVPLKHGRRR